MIRENLGEVGAAQFRVRIFIFGNFSQRPQWIEFGVSISQIWNSERAQPMNYDCVIAILLIIYYL